jgi:hypothetical protein
MHDWRSWSVRDKQDWGHALHRPISDFLLGMPPVFCALRFVNTATKGNPMTYQIGDEVLLDCRDVVRVQHVGADGRVMVCDVDPHGEMRYPRYVDASRLSGGGEPAAKKSRGRPASVGNGRRVNTFLGAGSVEIAERLGGGNVSAGIRRALALADVIVTI